MTDRLIKVLLIEDDPEYACLMHEMLTIAQGTRFDLECADRLAIGLERLATGGIDVVLLDLSLLDSWGLDTFARVHAQAPDVPIIVLSCLGDERLSMETVRAGAQDHLVKGQADTRLLVRAIRCAVEGKQAIDTPSKFSYTK